MARILVLDLGTTYFKIALFGRDGQLQHVRRVLPPIHGDPGGFLELDARRFAEVLAQGIAQLGERVGSLADVEAVTFATQTNSFVLLDAQDQPLTRLILWSDRRAADREAELIRRTGVPAFAATTGIPDVNHRFMIAKLLWLAHHRPKIWQRMSRLCLVSDYLTLLLTDRHVTEAGAAGLTGLVKIQPCQWWPEMLGQLGIPPEALPEIVRAGTDLGTISPQAASRFHLPEGCRCVVGCLDQYAGAIGAGNVRPGMVSETTGTVLATVRCADQLAAGLGSTVFQGPGFAKDRYFRMVFGDVSARYLDWYRQQLPDRPDFDQLTALAAKVEPGAEGLRLRSNARLTSAQDVFAGMAPRHSRGHAVRCIMEAVAFALADQVAALCGQSPPEEIRSAGGAARNDLWLQIKADVLGVPARATECEEPTSLGAAILAEASLAGADVASVAGRWVRLKTPHLSDPQQHRRYRSMRNSGVKV